ncbi:hypothetical protein [Micromonospora sp. WMMD736]|uniref:hypothetical protein n=1 Tax=Micromonospora sp. WMMD736 TaxID=3404112 RepID=UPI003B942843
MALTFFVEDQLHARLSTFSDDADNSFLGLARRLAVRGSRVFDIFDPYADAMFNYIQLDRMISELDDALQGDLTSTERSLVVRVKGAAQEARNVSGYLFVEGD